MKLITYAEKSIQLKKVSGLVGSANSGPAVSLAVYNVLTNKNLIDFLADLNVYYNKITDPYNRFEFQILMVNEVGNEHDDYLSSSVDSLSESKIIKFACDIK
jgi:hypothetical protein